MPSYLLSKGKCFSIAKSINKITVGLGWDVKNDSTSHVYNLDATAILVDRNGKGIEPVYFNNKKSLNGTICLLGDNLTREGDGDDK
ncbi:tellurium resistance protein TerD [Lasiosphaeria hispida]|uniref:Tellurium resistance protein TerD n=1 Tax=Lasiosphaeria hispida TaxID=260671 RepID=A0AAJ0HGS8_9PEZI|nr:tellurium resistance protein TerD [Lasiosphaeria hispida]